MDLATVQKAIEAVKKCQPNLSGMGAGTGFTPIVFRPEQEEAIEKTLKQFKTGSRMLWNAKMRFGKTLSALQVVKKSGFAKTIIVTHRPVVDDGWYEDFQKIFYDTDDYTYGSKGHGAAIEDLLNSGKKFVYFASIQDLRGSSTVGGKFDKNDAVFSLDWDLVIVDEAHEGTTTALGDDVIKNLVKEGNGYDTKFLALSGTPFNILKEFDDNIYTWDYVMEQQRKAQWDELHFGDSNPYDELPELKIYTYDLGKILTDKSYVELEDKAFNFREFFRVWTGDIKHDHKAMPATAQVGDFVHESDVWSFLNLITKDDPDSHYPYANEEYRNLFRHALWMVAKVLGAAKREDGYLEGNGYVVSWCVGHLVELAQPEVYDAKYSKWAYADLPIFPMDWQYEVSAGTKKQFGILKKLMAREDVASLVCATDAGREGELIFRLVYHKAGCRKPFERLWISSMEDVAIKEGFENLRSGTEYDALYEAALCRERADWIVGINATRLFSTLYGQTLNVGRVMTPTLAMAVMREAAISAFKPELFYTVQIGLDGFTAASERFKTKAAAEAVKQSCSVAIVQKAECKEKTEKPPALYDLTSLQREANRVLGYTAQQTLDYTQNLYEKKLVTYPRTDSRFLTEDMAHSLTDLVKLAFHTFPVEDVDNIPVHAEQVVNNKKVTDHHAIIPTRELQKCNLSELPKGELAILQLISNRLCVAVGDPHRYAETVIELDCGGTVFSTKGKTVVQDGWKALVQKNDSTKSDENVQTLPSVSVGDEMTVSGTEIKEGKTSPPKHFTEDTLLSAMETAGADEMPDEVERKGLGTPATRAGIIEKLVRIGFLERKGDKKTKHLIPTHKGTALVTVMPEQIQSPSMTADWEEKLLLIEKGEYASEDFMDEIKDVIAGLIQNYEVIRDSEVMMSKEANSIGKCPLCGSAVEDKAKAFFCSNRACKFALWKNNRYFASIGKSMTSATAQKLLGSGKVKLKNCKSERTGNTFDATVFMEVSDDGKTKFSMEFENGGKRK